MRVCDDTKRPPAMSVTSQAPFSSAEDNALLVLSSLWVNASLTSPRSGVESVTVGSNVTGRSVFGAEDVVWAHSPGVKVGATVAVGVLCGAALAVNALLFLTIQFSSSLKTPPNAHLLNICCTNLALTLHMLVAMPSLHLNSLDVQKKGSEILSGLQLFLLMHCLFQYWGAFASIGYYRFRTIRKPSLSLRVRKQLVSRSITITWVISLLVAMTFSMTASQNSDYLPLTLDPFRANYALKRPPETGPELSRKEQSSFENGYEQVVVMSFVVGGLFVGLFIIIKSYYSICRTLNLTGSVGRNRVCPWPGYASSLTATPCEQQVGPPTLDRTAASVGTRAYRPNQEGLPFCVSGQPAADSNQWVVHYQKLGHGVFLEDFLTMEKPHSHTNSSTASFKRSVYAGKRPLTATFSTGSTPSVGKGSLKYPDFSDISLGAEIIRLQRMQCRSALSKQTLRRERGSLSSASKNSLAMLVAFLLCSLPLIVCQVPGALSDISPEHRIVVLLVCRVLFFLNAPVYPMWYLLFSHRVKKCLTRMCEAFLIRFHFRQ